ncbi:two-component system, NtrC family, nitrogen regulation response regulator NtrX [Thermotomaculum hydrothermale]|uniref:Two-component system, NtrC family, nitrogen regulation response regulator NtrX n=1 Tax=Thermotomaculum hydrothermale TaxID=981385 RepID=A0A7R6PVA1_9BACT|nr:sigma-54 dependent transcriptional regulator [Thermotomaculum hydrothermale]BBB33342.1 two-component system, NtrC family, nitrogen regulation response regulator NtrX [Thermotomaculum hydrothermale]
MAERVLIIDDEKDIVESIANILALEGYSVLKATRGYDGLKIALNDNPDVVLLDIKMPVMDGLEVLEKLIENDFTNPVIIISGHGDIKTAVEAVQKGAFDFLEKPLGAEQILIAVKNAIQSIKKTDNLENNNNFFLIGESEAFRKVLAIAERVAKTSAPVLITGETGTGKEMIARYIHEKSGRKGNFVEVNCAAIPEELIESELFGHVKGSFTGAIDDKEGKFVAAHNGTLFLDEIGDMSFKTQAKVLRALQEKIIYAIGSNNPVPVNVRVISATNKDLKKEIEKGNFREDLFYRINVIEIEMPPLRERKDDIPLLAEHFAGIVAKENRLDNVVFEKDALEYLKSFEYRGNIRELKNKIEKIVILCQKPVINKDDVEKVLTGSISLDNLPLSEAKKVPELKQPNLLKAKTLKEVREMAEKYFIIEKLKENNFNISKTAEVIGVPRSNMYKKIEQYKINVKELEDYYGKG